MSQTKAQSLKETLSNTFIGTIGSFLITWVTFHFITNIVLASAITTVLCTVWSIARGYFVRRYFNNKQEAK
ncbi:hypothetical protein uav_139 [Pseudomonas phage UAVern]|uniref:Uncharacterized protein n=1 Tax=Pseudomonas phage UAVern TaxID=2856997 RepID=A0A975UY47_9CAUD|nr:hypothetical protein uav_139 [Pseudomonas phage UAVern]